MYIELIGERVLCVCLVLRAHCTFDGDGGSKLQTRLGMSVTTQGGSGRQCVTGPGRNIPKYRFVLLNVYRFGET